jgi:glucokinase-like ROK family protein
VPEPKPNVQRQINRSAVLNLIRRRGTISRPALAKQLNLSLPTVMKITDNLMAENLITSSGTADSTGGRPAEKLRINGDQFAIIGVDLGGTKSYGAITDLAGRVLYEVYAEHAQGSSDSRLEQLCAFIEQLIGALGTELPPIWGIGIGVPGITLRPDGVVVFAPSLDWRDLPLQQILSERFGVRVLVDNDVNLAALGEWEFGIGKGTQSLVYITIGTGIGAGIVINGQIYRGFNQAAGEIGHFIPGVSFLGQRYDQFGALEQVASGIGLRHLARKAVETHQLPLDPAEVNAEAVFAAASEGQEWAKALVQQAADHLAVAIAGISTVLNPEIVVLGGGVMKSGDVLVEMIRQRLQGAIPYIPRIEQSKIGYRAGALGAIAFVLEMTTDQVRLSQNY